MQAERAQLAQVMSQPFALRPDYEQTKQAFDHFVQDLRASKVMGCLQAMKACEDGSVLDYTSYGFDRLPVGVAGKRHL